MPNQVKYATSTPNHSLHKGEVAIGVNSVGMGPTSSTGWYNGHTPSSGNYIIFQTHTSGDPNIWVTNTSSELYQVVTTLGGGANDITSIGVALSWIASQEDLLAINSSLPNIVTDDLRFYWDAKLISSYSTEGVDWYDLSGKNNTGELQNGPTFNPNGYFEFDGVDDRTYQSSPDLELTNNACTLEILIKQTGTSNGYYRFFTQSGGSSGFGTYPLGIRGNDGFIVSYLGDTGNWAAGRPTYPDGTRALMGANAQWLHLCVVADLDISGETNRWIYLNGRVVESLTQTWNGTLPNGAGALYAASNPVGGVASMKIYNKALSQSEVNQNYHQSSIVTDGLIAAYDAGNLVSYDNSDSTTAYSLTGSITSTVDNGVDFSSENGGSWDFDGTNDYIQIMADGMGTFDNEEYSVDVWFNVDSLSGYNVLFSYDFSSHSPPYYAIHLRTEANGQILWGYNDISTTSWVGMSSPTGIITAGEWNHVCVTYTGGLQKMWINGELQNQRYYTGPTTFSNQEVWIGRGNWGSSYTNGKIPLLKYYNRVLTESEVKQNFNAVSSRFI